MFRRFAWRSEANPMIASVTGKVLASRKVLTHVAIHASHFKYGQSTNADSSALIACAPSFRHYKKQETANKGQSGGKHWPASATEPKSNEA
jgi:hypothetical protein